MTRPPDDEIRLDKLRTRQQMQVISATRRGGPGPAILLIGGWDLVLIGVVLALYLGDWHHVVAGLVLGIGNMFAGLFWQGVKE